MRAYKIGRDTDNRGAIQTEKGSERAHLIVSVLGSDGKNATERRWLQGGGILLRE